MSTEIRFESDPTGTPTVNEYPITAQVNVDETGVQLAPNRAGRKSVTIKNLGTDALYVSKEGVAAAAGFKLDASEGITIETERAVFGICAAAETATAAVLEDGPNK